MSSLQKVFVYFNNCRVKIAKGWKDWNIYLSVQPQLESWEHGYSLALVIQTVNDAKITGLFRSKIFRTRKLTHNML